jgi:hypothetical protein
MVDVLECSWIQFGTLLEAHNRKLAASMEAVLGLYPHDHGYCPLHYSSEGFVVVCRKCNYLQAGILKGTCQIQVPLAVASLWVGPYILLADIPQDGLTWLDSFVDPLMDKLWVDILLLFVEVHLYYHPSLPPVG